MVDELKNYYDFAENDYQYFVFSYNHGYVANRMASLAQEICEKFLKHIISEYTTPASDEENSEKARSLRKHNLVCLMAYIEENLPDFEIDDSKLRIIDGFYSTTQYPSKESFSVTKKDIEYCHDAVNECRNSVIQYIDKRNQEIEIVQSSDEDDSALSERKDDIAEQKFSLPPRPQRRR